MSSAKTSWMFVYRSTTYTLTNVPCSRYGRHCHNSGNRNCIYWVTALGSVAGIPWGNLCKDTAHSSCLCVDVVGCIGECQCGSSLITEPWSREYLVLVWLTSLHPARADHNRWKENIVAAGGYGLWKPGSGYTDMQVRFCNVLHSAMIWKVVQTQLVGVHLNHQTEI